MVCIKKTGRAVFRKKEITGGSGFSIMELLIAMLFLMFMATVAISTYSEGRESQSARAAAHELSAIIRTAQSDALSGKLFNECSASSDAVVGKVGLFFDISTQAKSAGVTVFVDKNNSRHCDNGCADSCGTSGGEMVKFIPFPGGVTIGNGGPESDAFIPFRDITQGINASRWSLLFMAPDPRVTLCRGSYIVSPILCDYTSLFVQLWSKARSVSYPVTIYTSGRIDIR